MKKFVFKPRARLLLQLGDQLIKNESIALLELLKNSYDADANVVQVSMENIEDPDQGIITIRDDGMGMDIDTVTNVWMEPGSDFKERLFAAKQVTPKHNRLPIGEKGIGRFGAHKLGYEIEMVSKKEGRQEVLLKINWNTFKDSRYLEDVPVSIIERIPSIFTHQTGTLITIRKLKTKWTRGMLREVYRSINSLCSPFDTPDAFKINFKSDKPEWFKDMLTWDKVKEYALFKVDCEIIGNEITKFNYKFQPWSSMNKLDLKQVSLKDREISKIKRMVKYEGKNLVPIDLSNHEIGPVRLELSIFDRDTNILRLGIQDKKGLKEYLDANGGIRVYRDKIRVYDYGEPGNDWLNLSLRRVNIPTKRISNNILIGAVHINRQGSEDLIEKTNREGFIENEAYNTFQEAVLYVLGIVETFRKVDKDRIRAIYGPNSKSEPVLGTISELKEHIERKVSDDNLKQEVLGYVSKIEADYKYINETLLRSAGAGLSLSVVIHEVEKIVAELKRVITTEMSSGRITALVTRLGDMLDGYSDIIRNTGRKNEDLKRIINQGVFNTEFRLEAHHVTVIKNYLDYQGSTIIKCSRNLVTGTILNIIDNSIWWLNYGEVKRKKIYITISEWATESICIVIADNGPGFSLPPEQIIKPFVSAKPDGMGLGLHIAHEIMEAQGGSLLFPDWGDFGLPEEYKNGAIVALCFKKEA